MEDEKSIAEEMGEKIKEISIAEFFEKNRHLLGYENPTKSLLTVVKELVDNSLDACLEARILPTIKVLVKEVKENVFRVVVEDNGPGLPPEKIPLAFGKFLVGSKFMRLRQNVGTQGIGAKGAILYAQLTTGKPAKITTYFKGKKHEFELTIDVIRNEPKVISKKEEPIEKNLHGLKVELLVEGRYIEKGQSIPTYLRYIWIANPFTKIVYDGPNSNFVLERVFNELPKEPKEIKPHPYGVEFGVFKRFLEITDRKTLLDFLTKEFSRISLKTAIKILRLSLRGEEIEIKNKEKKVFDILNNSFNSENVVKAVLEEMNLDGNKKIIDLN
ncbi:MAG: DNA topoisomerase VI subunit B, partial [Candidatus Aenigmatarchaeota archaeon]